MLLGLAGRMQRVPEKHKTVCNVCVGCGYVRSDPAAQGLPAEDEWPGHVGMTMQVRHDGPIARLEPSPRVRHPPSLLHVGKAERHDVAHPPSEGASEVHEKRMLLSGPGAVPQYKGGARVRRGGRVLECRDSSAVDLDA